MTIPVIPDPVQPPVRGTLTIFLGYAAGVGKTCAMLAAARQRQAEGSDVVVACVATRHQPLPEALLDGLEAVCPARTPAEMDLDGVLARRPQLAVVDELAHSNPPDRRHPKRSQDVAELLAAGIDVYTTVNIQELESLSEPVYQITGLRTHETVSDRVLDEAYEIELVDLPTDELIQRFKEGKTTLPGQPEKVVEEFFRKGNLTALRELAMRRAASRVDGQMRSYMAAEAIHGPWPATERILVGLSSHPLGERLVRAGRKLADDLGAEWFVLFVETPGHLSMPAANRSRVEHNLALAEKLGARVYKVTAQSVAGEIIHFCQKHNITKIVAGRPQRSRWQEVFQPSVVEEILRKSGRVDVYVINEDRQTLQPARRRSSWLPNPPLQRYPASLLLVGAATLINLAIHPYLAAENLVMIYLAAVVIAAVFLGRGPSMLASLVSVMVFDFFLVEPRFSFAVRDTQYLITFLGLLVVGLIISNLASLLSDQVAVLRKREAQTQAINRFSQDLTGAITLEQVLEIALENIGAVFKRGAVVLLPDEKGRLVQKSAPPGDTLGPAENEAAEWAYRNGLPAGRGSETLPHVENHYVPLKTSHGVVGVLGIRLQTSSDLLSPDEAALLGSFSNLSALAIERARFAEEALQAESLRTVERLQSALLNSISHQLRTPLATITGVLTSLGIAERGQPERYQLDAATRLQLIENATTQAVHLNRLVENLLAMTRLEAGALKVRQQAGDLQDLVGAVINQMGEVLQGRPLDIDIPPDFPAVCMDAVLTGQVLVNLLENAVKYSPEGSAIALSAAQKGQMAVIAVQDGGAGIPEDALERVFDKFYRVENTRRVSGTGLGLSICRGIVEAQGGRIWARNNPQQGVTVTFTLPIQAAEEREQGQP